MTIFQETGKSPRGVREVKFTAPAAKPAARNLQSVSSFMRLKDMEKSWLDFMYAFVVEMGCGFFQDHLIICLRKH